MDAIQGSEEPGRIGRAAAATAAISMAVLVGGYGGGALSTGRDTASVTAGFATAFFFLLLGRGVLAIVLAVPDACACAPVAASRRCCMGAEISLVVRTAGVG